MLNCLNKINTTILLQYLKCFYIAAQCRTVGEKVGSWKTEVGRRSKK